MRLATMTTEIQQAQISAAPEFKILMQTRYWIAVSNILRKFLVRQQENQYLCHAEDYY
jgi:hypothetical protein